MAQVEVQYVRGFGFTSGLIAYKGGGGKKGFSHGDIVLPDGRLLGARSEVMVINGIRYPAGVEMRPPDYEVWRRQVRFRVPCTEQQQEDFYSYANAQLHLPYDKTAIVAFVLDRDWREDDSWYCTELIAACFEKSGIMRALYVHPNKIDPTFCAGLTSAIGGYPTIDRYQQ